jgi:hypothetical protein
MYVLKIVEEPAQEGIMLTQADFDQLIASGKAALGEEAPTDEIPGATSTLVDFATIETIDPAGDFIFHGQVIDPESAALFCGRGLDEALRAALGRVA